MTQKQVLLSFIVDGSIISIEEINKSYTAKKINEVYNTLTGDKMVTKGKMKQVETLRRLVVSCTGGLFEEDRVGYIQENY